MKYTSAQANKLLKRLQEERNALLLNENQSRVFVAATSEDKEEARPEYDYVKTQRTLQTLEQQIRLVKHCINVFNLTHEAEGFDMTVDQLLVYIPQMSAQKEKLERMASRLARTRLNTSARSNIIEYEYANYDLERVREDCAAVSAELARAQLALDRLNSTETMEIDIE